MKSRRLAIRWLTNPIFAFTLRFIAADNFINFIQKVGKYDEKQ
jgi:hypothetical protein